MKNHHAMASKFRNANTNTSGKEDEINFGKQARYDINLVSEQIQLKIITIQEQRYNR